MQSGTKTFADMSHETEGPTGQSMDPDPGLVVRAQNGDMDAFERLVVKYQKRMLNIAVRLVLDYDEACEVVQDAFVSAYKNIKTFRGDAKFTTWLTAITLNLSRNRLKQMKARHARVPGSLDALIRTDEGEMKIDPPSGEPSVLDRMEQRDIRDRVQDCIKALEPGFREVLVLRDMQEFSYEEIGGMLRMREGTVKSRLFRAREAIKDCLKKVLGATWG